jgi:hypothetical protein
MKGGWGRGGYGFLFRSEYFFRTTRELDYFFFPPPKSEYFFQQHWESEYFFREKTYPPFKLNGRSLSKVILPQRVNYSLEVSYLNFLALIINSS